jgi:hypothetical protein
MEAQPEPDWGQSMTMQGQTTRRGFLAACGVGAAALAVPGGTAEARGFNDHLGGLFAWYRRMIERLAEHLRPRFEAGELRGNRSADYEDDDAPAWTGFYSTPMGRIEQAVNEWFQLEVKCEAGQWTGNDAKAHLILALSPYATEVDDGAYHPGQTAQEAAGGDVLDVARARGMYVPTADEAGPEVQS